MTGNIKMYVSVIKKTAANVKKISDELKTIEKGIQRIEEITEGKVAELKKRCAFLKDSIDKFEEPIRNLTNGYTTADLIEQEKDSRNRTVFKLKYPETIIPVTTDVEVDNPIEGEINDNFVLQIPENDINESSYDEKEESYNEDEYTEDLEEDDKDEDWDDWFTDNKRVIY